MANQNFEEIIKKLQGSKIEVFYGEKYVALSLVGELDVSLKHFIESHSEELTQIDQKMIALSFAYSSLVSDEKIDLFLKNLALFENKLIQKNKKLAIIRAPENLSKVIREKMPKLQLFRTLSEAIKSISIEYNPSSEIAEFQKKAIEIFKIQFGIELRPLGVKRVEKATSPALNQVVGLIPLLSDSVAGNLILRFTTSTIEKLGEMTFGRLIQVPDPEVMQIAGELANMILGSAKNQLNSQGFGFNQTLPQMFYSTPADPVNLKVSLPYWQAELESNVGNISLEISLRQMSDQKSTNGSIRVGQ